MFYVHESMFLCILHAGFAAQVEKLRTIFPDIYTPLDPFETPIQDKEKGGWLACAAIDERSLKTCSTMPYTYRTGSRNNSTSQAVEETHGSGFSLGTFALLSIVHVCSTCSR